MKTLLNPNHRLAAIVCLATFMLPFASAAPLPVFESLRPAASAAAQADAQAVQVVKTDKFDATLTRLDVWGISNSDHSGTFTIHFKNTSDKPLILGCSQSTVSITDDQGNKYFPTQVRGLGAIKSNRVDTKFTLAPGAESDAQFIVFFRGSGLRGVVYTVDATVREINQLAGDQLQLGSEHLLEFTNVKSGYQQKPEGSPDSFFKVCNAGPFTVQATHSTITGKAGRGLMTVTMTLKFTNTSDQPLILAYQDGSGLAVDDKGNGYGPCRPGAPDHSYSGIGVVKSNSADPSFTLKPGESKTARFSVIRDWQKQAYGSDITYFVAIRELKIMPSGQIIEGRQYVVGIDGISGTPGASLSLADAAKDILGILGKKH